ncbi:uncharacterized protein LOC128206151 isoform X2 [Mya arenaria]|uniref:uncharacterized protein LOC128206151 isoform X2 n=1 Tax=Mya arenaria TaxID=6604 RepID=UPI0022E219AD|nr:uncharacterized protein LOC128206151 isoform X2 [Mya arenaria]
MHIDIRCLFTYIMYAIHTFVDILICLGLPLGISGQHTVLSPVDPVGWEGEPLTLTCESSAEDVVGFGWNSRNRSDSSWFHLVAIIYNDVANLTCAFPAAEWAPNAALFDYNCILRTKHSLTLKNLTFDNRWDEWVCRSYSPTIESSHVNVSVLVPVKLVNIEQPTVDTLRIIENSSYTFVCMVMRSLPAASVLWYHDNKTPGLPADDVTLTSRALVTTEEILNADSTFKTTSCMDFQIFRSYHGVNLYCSASNRNDSRHVSNRNIFIDVLYGPQVELIPLFNIPEGNELSYKCGYIPGNPSEATFSWSRTSDDKHWNGQTLIINSTHRSDDDIYTCKVSNLMTTSENETQIGSDIKTMRVNVQYRSDVIEFYVDGLERKQSVIKAESELVTFVCTVDSNPGSTIELIKDNEVKHSVHDTNFIQFPTVRCTCWDAGVYSCRSSNQFNHDGPSVKNIELIITCSPRRMPGVRIQQTFSSPTHQNVTLSYRLFAYPVPKPWQFVWRRCPENDTCVDITLNITKFAASSSGLTCSLTVIGVKPEDYGTYTLTITNDIGNDLTEKFLLIREASPINESSSSTVGVAIGVSAAGFVVAVVAAISFFVVKRKYISSCPCKRSSGRNNQSSTNKVVEMAYFKRDQRHTTSVNTPDVSDAYDEVSTMEAFRYETLDINKIGTQTYVEIHSSGNDSQQQKPQLHQQ